MIQGSLLNYIRTQVSNGQRLDYVTSTLLRQGFSQQQIDEAYAQLGYSKSNQLTSAPLRATQKFLLPVVITILAIFVLIILGMFSFSKNKEKNPLTSSNPTFITPLPTTHAISQTLPNCSDPSRWITTVGISFNATISLKPVSVNTCEYTDSILGYTVQYPANWYIQFNLPNPAEAGNFTATSNEAAGNNGTVQPYNVISFDSQQLLSSNSSPLTVSIYITSSKTNYSDIISYMGSIQKVPAKSEAVNEQNVYKPVSFDGKKAIQLQYNVGDDAGIDTKFISNGILYDISFNSKNINAINANKQYYTNFLNSFTLKPTQ